jgi:hypothetical protein
MAESCQGKVLFSGWGVPAIFSFSAVSFLVSMASLQKQEDAGRVGMGVVAGKPPVWDNGARSPAGCLMPSLVFVPPHPVEVPREHVALFLAGSIEMGEAPDWQDALASTLMAHFSNLAVFNPRRPDWDASWPQDVNHAGFNGQVRWETDQIDAADIIVFYFAPGTLAPISLLELGLVAPCHGKNCTVVVVCPDGFWRKGNVDFIARKYGLLTVDDLAGVPGLLARDARLLATPV